MRTVLWDLDGTILDSEGLAKEGTRHGFLEILGRTPTADEFAHLVGRPVRLVYRAWFGDELGQQVLDAGSKHYDAHVEEIVSYEGVHTVLQELKRLGYRQGIVSSKRREKIVRELVLNGMEALFDTVVGQQDTDMHKPYPDPLLLAVTRLGVTARDCVYIGDQPSDMEAARAAGMQSIAALWGEGDMTRLRAVNPACCARKPDDVLDFLLGDSTMTASKGAL